MPRSSRTDRGRETELVAAARCRAVWPDANAVSRSVSGRDIHNTPPFAPEVKARADFNPNAWIRQAKRNAGNEKPVVFMRPNGLGPKDVGHWLTFMFLDDWLELCRLARLGRFRKKPRRAASEEPLRDSETLFSIRVGPDSDNSRNETVKAGLRTVLRLMDLESGEYEIQIRRITGGNS